MPKEDVWEERENYNLLAHVLILLLLLYGFVCVLCVYLGMHGKWGADPLLPKTRAQEKLPQRGIYKL